MPKCGKRIADDPVYLKENRYEQPKEYFKFIGRLVKESDYPSGSILLDVGCATGEFLYYIKQIVPDFGSFYGMDVSKRMIARARERVGGVNFFTGSVLNNRIFRERRYDVVTCIGVMSIFEDIEKFFKNLLSCVREGGSILIFTIFNDDPIDVIMRYRRADQEVGVWETGWNIFSCYTVENLLRNSGHKIKWTWHDFRLSFALKKRPEDAMRCWTMYTKENPYQEINGACQLINKKVLKIDMIRHGSKR